MGLKRVVLLASRRNSEKGNWVVVDEKPLIRGLKASVPNHLLV